MKNNINAFLQKMPGAWLLTSKVIQVVRGIKQSVINKLKAQKLANLSAEEVFTDIYKFREWKKGKKTVSGSGSDLEQTEKIRSELPELFSKLNISSVLDIPCGDFWWMKEVDIGNVRYIGADIVHELVERNRQYENDKRSFCKLDLIKDDLPSVDLIFVRDCLVHLSFDDIFKAFHNIVNSKSKYLLTTTFVGRDKNTGIATGQWRALNLVKSPFNLPEPEIIINENHTEYTDKCLGLWRVTDIEQCLQK